MQPAAYFAPIRQICSKLPAEYQVETLFINFSVSKAKKGCRQAPASGNSMYIGIPIVHEGRYRYFFTGKKSCNSVVIYFFF